MASLRFDGFEQNIERLNRLDTLPRASVLRICKAGASILSDKLKAAGSQFAGYMTLKKMKSSYLVSYGDHKTTSGARAGLAAGVYEYGRHKGGPHTHFQPARPFFNKTCSAAAGEVVEAMQKQLDEELRMLDS